MAINLYAVDDQHFGDLRPLVALQRCFSMSGSPFCLSRAHVSGAVPFLPMVSQYSTDQQVAVTGQNMLQYASEEEAGKHGHIR